MIRVQEPDFSLEQEHRALKQSGSTGAVVTFVGTVREFSNTSDDRFFLQHYPGMTERVLEKIEQRARSKWQLTGASIVHRVGHLNVDDQIVFVGASSAHRDHAFLAARYMIDILKTEAPFWKKEGDRWVNAKDSDQQQAERWLD